MLIKKAENNREQIIQLLTSLKLPAEDLPSLLDNFLVAVNSADQLMGVVGLEIYGDYGLLRSLAVLEQYQGKSIANKLVENIEHIAIANKLTAIYLLTETAPVYFEKKGYRTIMREAVPQEIKSSSEFSLVCPVSAIVMKKEIK